MPSAPLIPKIPPLRTDIQEPQQSSAVNRPPAQGALNGANTASNGSGPQHRTSKEWYYYWSKVGEQVVQNTQTLNGLVTYGPHSGKPDPSTMPDGAIAVESDRGAIYQNELIQGAPTWRYVAGTMWGTLSPDQRPTDLGVHDAGFEYRTTDQPPREFEWSGGAWVETTPVRYDTHANRLAQPVANLWEGALWVETDRGNVTYQLQGTAWHYIAGTMLGTLSPDQRPTDLGANDIGFTFFGTDQQQEFIWNGSAWVQTAVSGGAAFFAVASAAVTLTTAAQTIPGTTVTLTRAGLYLVTGTFYFNFSSVDNNSTLVGTASFGPGNVAAMYVSSASAVSMGATVGQQWLYRATAGASIFLEAYKSGGTGSSSTGATHTSISAIWVSP